MTKALIHITIRENYTRYEIKDKLVNIIHIWGDLNLADIFTKEYKYVQHFKIPKKSIR